MRIDPVRFWAKVDATGEGCWEWRGHRYEGYGRFWVGGRTLRAHRVAYELTHGPIPDGLVICHTCDNPPCVNPDHLFAGTQGDNNRDRHAKGRSRGPVGTKNGRCLLSPEDVEFIRATSMTGLALAARFGVAPSTIYAVRWGRNWGTSEAV